MKILCHVGPWCASHFETIAKGMDPDAEIVLVSGFQSIDQTGLSKDYYARVDSGESLDEFSSDEDNDIIIRCRLLRSIDPGTARRHVLAMRGAISAMLDRVAPEVVICESIDQYLHDILFREANARGIATFGMIRSFVNGFYRISERGEMVVTRTAPWDEVVAIRSKLTAETYIPSNLISLKKLPFVTYLRIMLSNNLRVLFFFAKRTLSGQKYNYHYWVSERTTRQIYRHLLPKLSFGDPGWRARIEDSERPVVYIPLQHFPEATIDYWVQDSDEVDYPARLHCYIEKLRRDFTVLIKEHPGVWGYRKPAFYRDLERHQEIVICPTNTQSQECIAAADAVLVWTGSVGFETALRGKAVLSVCKPYYASGERFLEISLSTPNRELLDFVARCRSTPVTPEEQADLVAYLLSGMFPGRFQNDGSFDPTNDVDVADATRIGKDLRRVFDDRKAANA